MAEENRRFKDLGHVSQYGRGAFSPPLEIPTAALGADMYAKGRTCSDDPWLRAEWQGWGDRCWPAGRPSN